jgi:hypothetical protein
VRRGARTPRFGDALTKHSTRGLVALREIA